MTLVRTADLGDGTTSYADAARTIVSVAEGTLTSGGGGLTPATTPSSVTDEANTYAGSGTYQAVRFADTNQVALALGIEGDAFPRWVFMADGTGGVYLGDGTADPLVGIAPHFVATDQGDGNLGFRIRGKAIELLSLVSSLRLDTGTNAGLSIRAGVGQGTPLLDLKDDTGTTVFSVLADGTGVGQVLTDTSDGHTYRIVSTNGVLSTEQVT